MWLSANTSLEPVVNKFGELFARERMRLLGDKTIAEYVARLNRDSKEAMNLYQHLSPPETWLFRYVASFEVLREELQKRDRSQMIHVASLGCATGSEPFSIAATALSCGLTPSHIRILALDYSDDHLAHTRTGRASALAQRTPIPQWAANWLHPTPQGQLELDAQGMAMIDYQRGDLSKWKPDRAFDFVFCRNVAIYLNEQSKRRLGRMLDETIKPNGLVFLGHADSTIFTGTNMRRSEMDHAFAFCKHEKANDKLNPLALGLSQDPWVAPFIQSSSIAGKPAIAAVHKIISTTSTRRTDSAPASSAGVMAARASMDVFTRAQIAADSGHLVEAEKLLLAYLAQEPTAIQGHALFGCVQMAQDKYADAQRSFTKVVYLDPLNGLALLSLAAIAELGGDSKGAQRLRDRAARTVVEK